MDWPNYKLFVKRILLILFIFSICRVLFFLFNFTYFEEAKFSTILQAFALGIRFDASVLFLLNFPFIIFSLLPGRFVSSPKYQYGLKVFFYSVNIPAIFFNLIDLEYFKIKNKRTTAEILGISNDVLEQSGQLLSYYWYIILIGLVLTFILVKMYPNENGNANEKLKSISFKKSVPLFLFCIPLSILIMRGGFQLKPLRPNHAFVFTPNVLGNLVLNTPFAFFSTLQTPGVNEVSFFKEDSEVLKYITDPPPTLSDSMRKDNVVIIILESFSSEYMGLGNAHKGYTPFLDSLAKEGLFFQNHFTNGTTSIEGLPSIIASIPSLSQEPFITSIYQTNEVHGIGEILKDKGYHTSFFHGGKNGTMGFDVFAKNAGFSEYYGLNQYPEKEKDFDGNWGIFDEPFLQYYADKLTGFNEPFLSSIFTLSSHQPYTIPAEHLGKFPKGEIPILESIGYSDYSLKKFFETAKTKPWFKNTLFVITADHTQERIKRNDIKGEFNVPLILFHPKLNKKEISINKVTQHLDIMPTILHFLGIETPPSKKILFGHSVLDESYGGKAINISWGNNKYNLIKNNLIFQFDPSGGGSDIIPLPDAKVDEGKLLNEKDSLKKEYEKELKAYIQYFNNGLVKNNWYSFSKEPTKK